jgi:hypothetical protein
VKVVPLTAMLRLLQSASVHERLQFGGLLKPGRHPAQSLAALKPSGQTLQSLPFQYDLQVHVQPVSDVPLTVDALPLQLPRLVHVREQFGPLYFGRHTPQSPEDDESKPLGQMLHVGPCQLLRHVH